MKHLYGILAGMLLVAAGLLPSCSITRNLPEGEVLYRGIDKIEVENRDETEGGKEALAEAEAALASKPNNAFFGSSSLKWPFPIGLWIYNDFIHAEKKVGKWIFERFAAKPVFISTVNPELRAKVAENLLHDYGYFNGTVGYEVLPMKNPRMAEVSYRIDMRNPFMLDSVAYLGFPFLADSLIRADWEERLVRKGQKFSVLDLDAERQRLNTLFRNNGYFYFRPDFISYRADTLIAPGAVHLQILPKPGLPEMAKKQWRVGNIAVNLSNYGTGKGLKRDTVTYKGMQVSFMGDKPPVRPSVLYRRLRFRPGDLYSQRRQTFTQEQFNRLGTFRFAEFQYAPQDTLPSCDRLDLRVNAAMDLPYDGELELNVTSKSNDQLGPGAVFNMSKKNVFRGGETFSLELRGSYEWQTNSSGAGGGSAINSYELGAAVSLDLPWIVFPWLHRRDFNFPAQTTFRLYGDQLNRAGFFKMLAFGGNATYTFQPTPLRRHTVTPFKLTFNVLQSTTERFDSIMNANRALYLSLDNQFIPAMSYTYTYDDALLADKRHHLWWETSVTSAGNLTSCVYAAFGQKFGARNKELMGNPFAQFLKLTSEVRYNFRIDADQRLAMRLMAGAIFSYGNSTVAPYSEQFFIGGANSIRAFTVRAVGPGSYHPEVETRYSYIDQTGDLKLEANLEYRFRIIGDLHGAVFMDAGNIWLLREDPARPGGQFKLSRFWKDIALGTGAGIRYDLSFLVVRFDVGVGLHVPYETSKRGYYNLPSFKRSLGYHLAIGYPF